MCQQTALGFYHELFNQQTGCLSSSKRKIRSLSDLRQFTGPIFTFVLLSDSWQVDYLQYVTAALTIIRLTYRVVLLDCKETSWFSLSYRGQLDFPCGQLLEDKLITCRLLNWHQTGWLSMKAARLTANTLTLHEGCYSGLRKDDFPCWLILW